MQKLEITKKNRTFVAEILNALLHKKQPYKKYVWTNNTARS